MKQSYRDQLELSPGQLEQIKKVQQQALTIHSQLTSFQGILKIGAVMLAIFVAFFAGFLLGNSAQENLIQESFQFLSQQPEEVPKQTYFTSSRVPIQFKIPTDFRMAVLKDWQLYQTGDDIESINFGTFDSCLNAGCAETGYLKVYRANQVFGDEIITQNLLEPYRERYENAQDFSSLKSGLPDTVEAFLPEVEKRELPSGNTVYVVSEKYRTGSFAPLQVSYHFFYNGLEVRIVQFEGISETDQQHIAEIVETLEFLY